MGRALRAILPFEGVFVAQASGPRGDSRLRSTPRITYRLLEDDLSTSRRTDLRAPKIHAALGIVST